MRKVIISTVGTSILNGYQGGNSITSSFEAYKFEIDAGKFIENKINENRHDYSKISAEINSLNKIGVDKNDILVFLSTETEDGQFCCKQVECFCKNGFGAECFCYKIPGLQVENAKLFEKTGLANYVEKVLEIWDRYQGYKIIINPTGGFKAVVPYTTLIGLVFGLPIYYIFERSNQLIKMPGVPINFDHRVLGMLSPVIDRIKDDYIELKDFMQHTGLGYKEFDKLQGAIVQEDNMITLSPIGNLLYRRYLYTNEYKVVWSQEVYRKKQSGRYDWGKLSSIFEKMKNPIHLNSKLHNEVKGKNIDCNCYKGGNTSERVFYYIEDKIIKVCDIYLHDEYEEVLKTGKVLRRNYVFDE